MNAVPVEKIAPRFALPAWVYNNAEMTRLEFERILKPSWQIVCHVSQIPNAGRLHHLRLRARKRHRGARQERRGARPLQRVPPPRHAHPGGQRHLPRRHHLPLPRLDLPVRRHAAGGEHARQLRRLRPRPVLAVPGARGDHARLRVRVPGRGPAASRSRCGPRCSRSSRPTASRNWCRSPRCTRSTGTSTGRSRWTTTWSPTTCRWDIRG